MSGDLAPVIGLGLSSLVVVLTVFPMPCRSPISTPPFRGCRRRVVGLVGRCRNHGRRPGVRVICLFGGEQLGRRRVCDKCGQPQVFGRLQDTGKPFLGCVRYPNCKNAKLLAGYRS